MNDLKINTRISPQAQSILHWVFGTDYEPERIDTAFARLMKPSGVSDFGNSNNWIQSIRPNPAQDNVTIDFVNALPNNAELEIRDFTGRLIKRFVLAENNYSSTINVSSFSKGFYKMQLLINNIPCQSKQFGKF